MSDTRTQMLERRVALLLDQLARAKAPAKPELELKLRNAQRRLEWYRADPEGIPTKVANNPNWKPMQFNVRRKPTTEPGVPEPTAEAVIEAEIEALEATE